MLKSVRTVRGNVIAIPAVNFGMLFLPLHKFGFFISASIPADACIISYILNQDFCSRDLSGPVPLL